MNNLKLNIYNDVPKWSKVPHEKTVTQVMFPWHNSNTGEPYIWMPTKPEIIQIIEHYILAEKDSWAKDVRMDLMEAVMKIPFKQELPRGKGGC